MRTSHFQAILILYCMIKLHTEEHEREARVSGPACAICMRHGRTFFAPFFVNNELPLQSGS